MTAASWRTDADRALVTFLAIGDELARKEPSGTERCARGLRALESAHLFERMFADRFMPATEAAIDQAIANVTDTGTSDPTALPADRTGNDVEPEDEPDDLLPVITRLIVRAAATIIAAALIFTWAGTTAAKALTSWTTNSTVSATNTQPPAATATTSSSANATGPTSKPSVSTGAPTRTTTGNALIVVLAVVGIGGLAARIWQKGGRL